MSESASPVFCGLVLAAGAGTRYGMPKALARTDEGEPWVRRAVRALHEGGCQDVLVAVGADASAAAMLVPSDARPVTVAGWREGVSASVRAGLEEAATGPAEAVVVVPVDTPSLPAAAVERVIRTVRVQHHPRSALVQAVYGDRPGHPVVIGREHWASLAATLTGDEGARGYLRAHGALDVDCADLWDGADIDMPPAA